MELYPDQIETIMKAREAMRFHKSVLITAPTGCGKTVMAASMIQSALSKGHTCGFFVPRRELLNQMALTMREFGVDHSYVAAGYPHRPHFNTHIHSIGSSVRRLDDLRAPTLAFLDETHYGNDALDQVIQWLKASGSFIVGLSATPWRLNGKGLGKWYSALVNGPDIATLIQLGRLSKYRLFAPSAPDLSRIKTVAGDYAKGDLADFMESDRILVGDAATHYKKHAMGKLNVGFTVSRKASEIAAYEFRQAGILAATIDGTMSDDQRRSIIKAFARREILTLFSVDLLTFGFDLSSASGMDVTVEAMSDLRPTKSLALQMQKWGRVLRRKSEPAIIFDHSLNYVEHGYPDDAREWTLSDRLTTGTRKGEVAIPIKRCPMCMFTHRPASNCTNCGFEYPIQSREIERVDGELEEVAREDRAAAKAARMEVGQARTRADLTRIAKERGYRAGWIHKQCQLKGIVS